MQTEVRPVDGYVTVDGMRLHYLAWGDPADRPIVCLHGAAQQAHSWDFVARDLCRDHYVVVLDQRGHGDSDWAPNHDYSPEAHQRDIRGFVEALGLPPFLLIGLSMGGANSIRYTAENPGRVKALVIVDIGPQVREAGTREIRNFVKQPDELDTFEDFVDRAHAFNPLRPKESYRGSLVHNLKQLPNGKWTWKYDKFFRTERAERPEHPRPDLWPFIHKLTLPTMVVRGEKSAVFSEENAQKLVEALPDVHYTVIPNAGHTVPGDQPELFAAAVRDWLHARRPEDV